MRGWSIITASVGVRELTVMTTERFGISTRDRFASIMSCESTVAGHQTAPGNHYTKGLATRSWMRHGQQCRTFIGCYGGVCIKPRARLSPAVSAVCYVTKKGLARFLCSN